MCSYNILGATLNLGLAGERLLELSNLTIQYNGVLEFHSVYQQSMDAWELKVYSCTDMGHG